MSKERLLMLEEGRKMKSKPIDMSYKKMEYNDDINDDFVARLRKRMIQQKIEKIEMEKERLEQE